MLALWNNAYTPLEAGTQNALLPPTLTISTTQTTVTVRINNKYSEYTYVCDGEVIKDEGLTITGYNPGDQGSLYIHVQKSESDRTADYRISESFETQSINPSIEYSRTASSFTLWGSRSSGDANVVKHIFECGGITYIDDTNNAD